MTRTLVYEDDQVSVYEIRDAQGALLGTDVEGKPVLEETNRQDMRGKLTTALGVNAAYQALGSPTSAQNLAQIRALTKECNALIRMQLDMLADTTGT